MKPGLTVWMLFGVLMTMTGCTNYYRVMDPASGKAYYTTKVKDAGGAGAVKFKDAKTGSLVTLQSSEIKEIPAEDFEAAIKNQPTSPPPQPPAQK